MGNGKWNLRRIARLSQLYSRPLGFYKCDQMPFGLMNTLVMFQCLMETYFGNLQFQWCIIYLDDMIIFAATLKEHLERLCTVLSWLWLARLKLQPTKYEFFKVNVVYLGHKISKEGIQTNSHKVEAIKNWPAPIMVTELRSFLGFRNYYWHFIEGYAKVSHPFYNRIPGDNAAHKTRKIPWMDECQEAFDTLKVLCTSTPILAYADFTKPFKLHTNASDIGLGAILHQEQHGKDRVIRYASRSLSKSESHYPAHKLEFLALKWAVTESFQEYLYGNTFALYSKTTLWPMSCNC